MYRLSDDYMNVDCLVHRLWQGEYREALAVIKGKYHYYVVYPLKETEDGLEMIYQDTAEFE